MILLSHIIFTNADPFLMHIRRFKQTRAYSMESAIRVRNFDKGNVHPAIAIGMAELLDRIAQDRDKQAFKELFLSYAPKVKGLLIRQGADQQTAEELTQETMLTVWKKAHLFSNSQGSASTWIFTIARNLRIDRLRSEKIWSVMNYEILDQVSEAPSQDEHYIAEQRKMKLKTVLKQLPDEQYEIVNLSYLEGKSHSEISQTLNIPLGTVKSRMRLAYKRIKEMLEGTI